MKVLYFVLHSWEGDTGVQTFKIRVPLTLLKWLLWKLEEKQNVKEV